MPTLDDIMKRERMAIKRKYMLEEEKKNIITVKTRTGKIVRVPSLKPKPVDGEGCSLENGFPCRAVFDVEVRKHAERRKGLSREEV